MSEPRKIIPLRSAALPAPDDGRMIVTMTITELRSLIAEVVRGEKNSNDPTLLTPDELADKIKIPVSWVYEQSRMGDIPTHRLGKYIRFDLAEVLQSQRDKKKTS